MKLIKIFAITGLAALTLGGCSDSFLDADLLDQKTDANFYRTKEDAMLALVGAYDGLQTVWQAGVAFPVASEVLSDNCFGGTGNSDGFGYQMIDQFDKSVSPSDANMFEANWEDYYKAIYRCNVFLTKIDQIDWEGDEELRNQYEAEIRFLRAYSYFDLVRMFGNIPLLDEPSSENIPQANPDDVYKLIANDLKFAAENLPAEPYSSPAKDGRVTKWAAESMIGRVFLYYTGYYNKADLAGVITQEQALTYLEDVIANSGHALVEDFANLWPAASVDDYAGEGNAETIFSIKYTYTSDYDGNTDGNHWMVMFGIREQSLYPYGNGWGGATVNPKLYDAFSDNDTRKVASIISIEDEELPFEQINKQREYTGYYIKKYSPMSDEAGNSLAVKLGGTNFMIGQFQDYVSIRYADVLLMAAELGSPNAQDYFDEVRQRAYKDNFTSQPATSENIMRERRFEFAFEGHRYWDLLRQGLNVAANAINEPGITVLNGGNPATKKVTFNEQTKGLQQIPNNQITLSSGVLKQNTGW